MKRKLRGVKRRDIQLDYDLYRVDCTGDECLAPLLLPNTDAKTVDLITGEDAPTGQLGELAVKGPQVMQGYWGEDSSDMIRDGWLYTGDVAVCDSDGYFQIISRKKDTIEPRVKAFVVPRPGTELTQQELLDLCQRRLEPYAVPWEIELREQLPKSFVGKVLRRLLIENE